MLKKKDRIALNDSEKDIMIEALNDYRNRQIDEGRDTDDVDRLLLKAADTRRERDDGYGGR